MQMKKFCMALLCMLLATGPVALFAEELDTDGDGLNDAMEDMNNNQQRDGNETDLFNADSDGGGESDGSEVKANRNPLVKEDDSTFDADGDGWVNGIEILRGTDSLKKDSDDDGLVDSQDPFPLQGKFKEDYGNNGLPDEWERLTKLSTQSGQTLQSDPDNDGLSNAEELAAGTDPLALDTDQDGISDKDEIVAQTNPRENACLTVLPISDPFPDMTKHWSKEFVVKISRASAISGMPIVRGYASGTGALFLPDRPVTRYEFLKMALLSACIKLETDTLDASVRFSDVNSIAPLKESDDQKMRRQVVYTAVKKGIVTGYSDGTFKPDGIVNRAEALKILALTTRLSAPEEAKNLYRIFPDAQTVDWFVPYVNISVWFDLVSGYGDGLLRPGNPMTRAEAAKILYLTMLINPLINGYVLPPI